MTPPQEIERKDPSEFTPYTSLTRKVYLILPLSFLSSETLREIVTSELVFVVRKQLNIH